MDALNVVATKTGKLRAVCQFCGRKTGPKPMRPDGQRRVGLADLPNGWGMIPQFDHVVNGDGSTGTTYMCPACHKLPFPREPLVPRG